MKIHKGPILSLYKRKQNVFYCVNRVRAMRSGHKGAENSFEQFLEMCDLKAGWTFLDLSVLNLLVAMTTLEGQLTEKMVFLDESYCFPEGIDLVISTKRSWLGDLKIRDRATKALVFETEGVQ